MMSEQDMSKLVYDDAQNTTQTDLSMENISTSSRGNKQERKLRKKRKIQVFDFPCEANLFIKGRKKRKGVIAKCSDFFLDIMDR
jgi:predicted RNase H-like nuclease